MIELEYKNDRIEVKYKVGDREIVMTPDEMIAYINNNSEINDGVGFVVPFPAYEEASKCAEKIDKAMEYRKERRR